MLDAARAVLKVITIVFFCTIMIWSAVDFDAFMKNETVKMMKCLVKRANVCFPFMDRTVIYLDWCESKMAYHNRYDQRWSFLEKKAVNCIYLRQNWLRNGLVIFLIKKKYLLPYFYRCVYWTHKPSLNFHGFYDRCLTISFSWMITLSRLSISIEMFFDFC